MKLWKRVFAAHNLCVTLLVGFMLGLPMLAQAALSDRGVFDGVNLIYDDTQDITWLGDANFGAGSAFDDDAASSTLTDGRMLGTNAVLWADSLTVGGFTDWRLPTTMQPDATCSSKDSFGLGLDVGTGCEGSEMGHLFNVDGISKADPGLFINVSVGSGDIYWSGTSLPAPFDGSLFTFDFRNGEQFFSGASFDGFAWAVHDGDIGASVVPLPAAAWLFVSALLGLLTARSSVNGTNVMNHPHPCC